jgi:photosystem II stability/assembly factor-like uncharacterized protein
MKICTSFRRSPLTVIALTALGSILLFPVPLRAQETATTTSVPLPATASNPISLLMKDLPWRAIGPAIMGGRIDDIAVVESDPRIVYAATAAGGLMKTVNHGTTWEMVFDNEVTSSIGDVTVAPSDPNVVYVGTGESNNRQSSSWGYGVYKSTDAGKTWKHLGLEGTHHIGRIEVHPTNPNIAYVAATGRLWGASKERGVYKTSDGGATWEQVFAIDADTGCTDILIDPKNPDTLYAAMYQRRRTAFGFAGGGAGSGLYRTTDGGKTWKKMEGGFPTGIMGRIGLSLHLKDPKIVYAIVETRNSGSTQNTAGGGIYRTKDGGETWEKRSDFNPRPMYFSQIRVDPNDPEKVWVLGVQTFVSTDGGQRFSGTFVSRVHADGHALWINPKDSNHLILGTDGGMQWSWDGGRTWDFANNIPISQFYEVAFDYRKPYWVYGGLQDNGTWGAPSMLPSSRGITNDEWINVGGGDGFYAQADPFDPNIIYTESQQGSMRRLNVATGEAKSIRPRPNPGESYQFDWNTPILISPHNPQKLIVGGNRLFISTDRGDTWRRTDDLTTKPDRAKLPIMGKLVTRETLSANDGQSSFGQIVTVTESPLKEGVLYIGTDDGNLQVSKDDGKTWEDVTAKLPGVPKGTYVSRVHASAHEPGRCYVSLDGHRSDDFKPYIFVTEDYGQTWKPIVANLPEGGTVSVIREHPRTANLLFVGTERGIYVSFDRGVKWYRFEAPFPTSIPVDDIQIHPRDNDLILATHARGIWILDDLGAFETLAQNQNLTTPTLAPPKYAVAWRLANRKGVTGHKIYVAPNPDFTATLKVYLPTGTEEVNLAVLDKEGKTTIRDLRIARPKPGWNDVPWDLRHNSPVPATQNPRGQGGFGNFTPRGTRVLPGTYTVRLTVGSTKQVQNIVVEDDPRITLSDRDRKANYDEAMRLSELYATADTTRRSLARLRSQLTETQSKATGETKAQVDALLTQITALEQEIAPIPRRQAGQNSAAGQGGQSGQGGQQGGQEEDAPAPPVITNPLALRIARLLSGMDSFTEPLSKANRTESKAIETDVKRIIRLTNEINEKQLPALNKKLLENSVPAIKPEPKIAE